MCLFMVTSTNFSLDKFYFLIWVKDSQSDAWTIARASPGNHLKHTLSGPSPDLLNQELGLGVLGTLQLTVMYAEA